MPDSTVAIHQPNFFPWLGYFDKIARADIFILLDDVQFPKTGGSWTNRVTILSNGKARWFTAPIDRSYSGVRTIDQMQFAAGTWRETLCAQLHASYHKASYYREAMACIEPLLMHDASNIADYNMHALRALCDILDLPDHHMRSSRAVSVGGTATERLVSLTQAVSGTHYLCGGGAGGYQEDAAFDAAGIGLTYQSFVPPYYPQNGTADFVAGLSIIDSLMQCGIAGTRNLVHTGTADA